MGRRDVLICRIRGEYTEMPGLRLTSRQACRLWQLDVSTCEAILNDLVQERFLDRTRDGAFVRAEAGERGLALSVSARLQVV